MTWQGRTSWYQTIKPTHWLQWISLKYSTSNGSTFQFPEDIWSSTTKILLVTPWTSAIPKEQDGLPTIIFQWLSLLKLLVCNQPTKKKSTPRKWMAYNLHSTSIFPVKSWKYTPFLNQPTKKELTVLRWQMWVPWAWLKLHGFNASRRNWLLRWRRKVGMMPYRHVALRREDQKGDHTNKRGGMVVVFFEWVFIYMFFFCGGRCEKRRFTESEPWKIKLGKLLSNEVSGM